MATCGALLLALCGCSESAYPIFDSPAEESDELPAVFDDLEPDFVARYDSSSVRFAAEHEGAELYLIKDDVGGICLAIASGNNSSIACGAVGRLGTSTSGAGEFEVDPAPIAERDGWTILSENICVKDD